MKTNRRNFLATVPALGLGVPLLAQTTTKVPHVSDTLMQAYGDSITNLQYKLYKGQPAYLELAIAGNLTQVWFNYLLNEDGYTPFLRTFIEQAVVVAPLTPQQLSTIRTVQAGLPQFTMTDQQAARVLLLAETNFAATQHAYAASGPKGLSDAVISVLSTAASTPRIALNTRRPAGSLIQDQNDVPLGIAIQYLAAYCYGLSGGSLPGIDGIASPLTQLIPACRSWNYAHEAFLFVMAALV